MGFLRSWLSNKILSHTCIYEKPKQTMKKMLYLTVTALIGLAVCAFTFTSHTDATKVAKRMTVPPKRPSQDPMLKRGEYLVTIMGCADCHASKKLTPQGPAPDMDRFLAGYNSAEPLGTYDKNLVKTGQWVLFNGQTTAFVGPWGVSFAANLTPDATGIGTWSLEQFTRALREGKSKGLATGRPLLPPMPWPSFKHMTNGDIQAVFTYLKSLKPVNNVVPDPIPPGQ
jgi:hypothetical protein